MHKPGSVLPASKPIASLTKTITSNNGEDTNKEAKERQEKSDDARRQLVDQNIYIPGDQILQPMLEPTNNNNANKPDSEGQVAPPQDLSEHPVIESFPSPM